MIDRKVLAQVRNGVCAIGYLTVPLERYMKKPDEPYFKVVGTGFLIEKTTVMTNRHVIQGLFLEQADLGFPSTQFFILFVVPTQIDNANIVLRMIRSMAFVEQEEVDVGFVDFAIVRENDFEAVSPLSLAVSLGLQVSEEIAVCGYPYGTSMLTKNGKFYRWGAVIQQGAISALSPFDNAAQPNEVLLDVRTAPGMSGAPIFRPSSGEVVGIHHSGVEAITAIGLPITAAYVDLWRKSAKQVGDSHPYNPGKPEA